jgi:uncharacterized LabA/DUF88 family protein
MRSAAIFIDAGYLFSAGSDLAYGSVVKRHKLELHEPEALIQKIMDAANECWDGEPLRLLRTYWYDGAFDGVPSPTQILVGDLPRVKLRLGRLTAGGQKGVDGLIILDLITLARNRAVDVAILVSGDEDLRETALHAQSFGLTMIVAGFPSTLRQGQSVLLLREADHVISLSKADIEPHLALAAEASSSWATSPVPDPVGQFDHTSVSDQVAPEASSSHDGTGQQPISAPDPSEADESLQNLCRGVVDDPRFESRDAILDASGSSPRLTRQADRVLIARLADLTGNFPVEQALVQRSRDMCLDLIRKNSRFHNA